MPLHLHQTHCYIKIAEYFRPDDTCRRQNAAHTVQPPRIHSIPILNSQTRVIYAGTLYFHYTSIQMVLLYVVRPVCIILRRYTNGNSCAFSMCYRYILFFFYPHIRRRHWLRLQQRKIHTQTFLFYLVHEHSTAHARTHRHK